MELSTNIKSITEKLPIAIKTKAEDLVKIQLSEFATKEKYLSVLKAEENEYGITYWVDEYIAPPYTKDSRGYQVYLRDKDGNEMSFGEGSEADKRSFDWRHSDSSEVKPNCLPCKVI